MSNHRRTFDTRFKLEAFLDELHGEKPIAQIGRERNIKDSLYYRWREQFEQCASASFGASAPDRRVQEQE
jgi:transposase-like protein